MKLTKAQKEVVAKMKQGADVIKKRFHPYTYKMYDSDASQWKTLNAASMKSLSKSGIIASANADIHYCDITLTETGKNIEI